jgi:tetratricopeptide (TPR) repeat protein
MTYLNIEHEKAIVSLKAGQYDLALEQIQAALQIDKSHPVLLAERGTIYMYMKRKEDALEDMHLAVYLQPENPYRYSSRAYVRDFFGDTDGAIEDYEKCLELDPEDIIAMNNLGLLIEKQGNRKKAEKYFKQTDELLGRNPDWQNKISNADENQNNLEPSQKTELNGSHISIPLQKSEPKEQPTKAKVIKEVFTKKSVFKEFLEFVKNGFKMK